MTRTWEACRQLWQDSETRWLLSPDQIVEAWSGGRCGQCGRQYADHAQLTEVPTADAVLMRPDVRVDLAQAEIDQLMGRLTVAQYAALLAAAGTALAALSPDTPLVLSGGSR